MNKVRLIELSCEGEALILCATSRLAQDLQRQHANLKHDQGLKRWPTLRTLTVDQWLRQLEDDWMLSLPLDALPLSRKVLTDTEVAWVFEDIIRRSLPHVALFDVAALAHDAAIAHRLSVIWSMPAFSAPGSEEQRQFLGWQRAFNALCEANHWLDPASHQSLLVQSLNRFPEYLPRHLLFAGFDRYTPIERTIWQAVEGHGLRVSELELGVTPPLPEVRSYPDINSECLAAAQWAATYLEAHPQARLGWVVPDLNRLRLRIEDTLHQVLAPSAMRTIHHENPRTYNISLGRPLSTYPLIRAAIDLLRVAFNPSPDIPFERLSDLMVSAFWSHAQTEGDARAMIDARMREGRGDAMSWSHALQTVNHWADRLHASVPNALKHLGHLVEPSQTWGSHRLLPSQWTPIFESVLKHGGWLAEYELSSHEYQTRQAFADMFEQLADLDEVMGRTEVHQALKRLNQLCAQRVFQPQTTGQPALQVLGTLEASGLSFDALWIMGMNDSVWPPPAQPSPFLPISWQRQQQTPNASSEVQSAFADSVMTRLLSAAPQVICSWSRMDNDSELRPSPVLKPWLPGQSCTTPERHDWVAQAARHRPMNLDVPRPDDRAPPVAEGEHVPGGSGLLRAQAICPAWAYYRYRLGAKKLNTPREGLDSATRGTLVHDALCHFWRAVPSLAALKACSMDALTRHIQISVDQALDRYSSQPDHLPLSASEQLLEFDRLCKLLKRWVAVEHGRVLPFRVIETEKSVQVTLEGLDMRLQIDRIDELEDGRWIIMDYKTGRSVDFKNWASTRITEPQLPLYAVMSCVDPTQLAGVIFGKVRLRGKEAGFAGLTAEADLLPSVDPFNSNKLRKLYPEVHFPDWSSVLHHWQTQLHRVAREVRDGVASVNFENESDLQYCDVLPLLRLTERQLQQEQWMRGERV